MIARLLRQHGARRIEYCFCLPCISLHATCCVDSDFLFIHIYVHIGVCVFRVVIAMFAFCLTLCFQQVFWFLLFVHSSSRVLLLCWRLDRLMFFDFCLHSYRPWIKNAAFILRTAKTESSAETTISCHVCD